VRITPHSDFVKAFGANLRAIRKNKGLTQQVLAYMSDIELSTLNRIELGKASTSLNQIESIAKALEIKPKELFDF
jgi:transcriptional regulator with XRE-family HTH domain